MVVDTKKLIAAIVPDIYCDPKSRSEVKKIAKERGYLEAAEKAKLIESDYIDLEKEDYVGNPFKLSGIKNPIEQHKISYDSFSQSLEPIYFFIHDYLAARYNKGAEKLIDNFVTSPGSAQFSEMGQKLTRMQEEAMKMIGTAGAIIKSILNIVYDLKEFKIRLSLYDDLKSKDPKIRNAAKLNLKQLWMDQVDTAKRGTGSINALAQQLDFVTLRDAFMAASSLEKIDEMDLNERVKRLLKQRVAEFERWLKESESELRKRFEIERVYLKNQVNSVRLYARWIKPYLMAAKELEQRTEPTAEVVNSFNTSLLELVILGKGEYDIEQDIRDDKLPKSFKKITEKNYKFIALVEFKFRTAPERTQQGGYGYRGKVDITFTSFALNDAELKVLSKELAKDDLGDLMNYVLGSTDESLDAVKVDLDEFLEEKKPSEKEEEKDSEDINPFTALFSIFKKEKKKESEDELPRDTTEEKVIRSQAILKARLECNNLYKAYKGSNNMPSF